MTLREWLERYTRNIDAQFMCSWRKRALRAIRPVVEQFLAERDAGVDVHAGHLLAGVDAAATHAKIRPTGKRWQQERRELVLILQRSREYWSKPAAEEAGACLVAADLFELKRDDEAKALLDTEAAGRYSRPCRACGAEIGEPCVDIEARVLHEHRQLRIPHEARVAA